MQSSEERKPDPTEPEPGGETDGTAETSPEAAPEAAPEAEREPDPSPDEHERAAREADAREALRRALAEADGPALDAMLDPIPLSEALRRLLELSPAERTAVLSLLSPTLAAELIEEAPNEVAVDLVERLEAGRAATILEELDSDVQADVIGELEPANAEAILAAMEPEDAADVRRLAEYEDFTAGGLMVAEAFTFRETDTVGAVLRGLATEDEDFERYRGQHPYIVDAEDHPIGVVSLRSLLTARRTARLTDIMVEPITVPVDADLDALQDLFDEHPFLGLPVVEADGRLVGVVSRAAVGEALLERAETASLRRQRLGDELRSMPLAIRSRRRLAWLSANIVLNIIAASVISAYEETLAAVIAIAVFLPMVSDMSGCSGNQAVGVTMRELSLGLVRPVDAFRVWIKEASVGLINGACLGILIGIVAWIWKGNAWLGLVIGAALAVNTLIAVSIGGVVPLLLKRFGQDPAAASGPLLTTITDMAGFFLVLSLATLFMPYLI
jgi:magnesium transporter